MNYSQRAHLAAPLTLLGLAASAVAQGLITTQGQLVAAPAQAVATVPGAFLSYAYRMCADDDGNIAWIGQLRQGGPAGVTIDNDTVLCLGRTEQDQVLLARKGMAAPHRPAGSTVTFLGHGVVMAPRGGEVGWYGLLNEPNNSFSVALYLSSASGHALVCRQGDPLPPPVTGTIAALGSGDLTGYSIVAPGRVVAQVAGSLANGRGGTVALAGQVGQLETVLYPGQVFTTHPAQPALGYFEANNMVAPDGSFPFTGGLEIGSGNPAVIFNDSVVLGVCRPGQAPVVLARQGEPAPGLVGANWNYPQITSQNMGPNGEFTVLTSLTGPGVTQGVDDWALYRGSVAGGTPELVIRRGAALGDGSSLDFNLYKEVIGQHGEIGGWCARRGPNVTSANDMAFLFGTPGAMSVLFREGDPLPGVPGATFGGSFGSSGNSLDRHGNLVLSMNYRPATGGDVPALLAYHPVRGWTDVMHAGDTLGSPMGNVSVNYDNGAFQRARVGGATSMHTLDGDIVRLCGVSVATHTGVVQGDAIVRTHLGDLRATPASIPATGGLQALRFDAGPARAGNFYLMLGSLSGTSPGFQYGGFEIPLVNDFWVGISQQSANSSVYLNSLGALDASGTGLSVFALPSNVSFLRGAMFHHAVVALDPSTAAVTWVSRPASVHVY